MLWKCTCFSFNRFGWHCRRLFYLFIFFFNIHARWKTYTNIWKSILNKHNLYGVWLWLCLLAPFSTIFKLYRAKKNLYDKHLLLIKDKSSIRLDRISASNYPRDNLSGFEIVLNMTEMVITGHQSINQSWYWCGILQFCNLKMFNYEIPNFNFLITKL